MAEPATTDRIAWIDAARGIGIVLVVIGHVERGLVAAGIAPGPTWQWLDYGLYTFHMPLFFVLAGLNVPHSLAKGPGRFLRSKLWTIAYPYLLWSLIQGGALIAASSLTNGQAEPSDLVAIGWRPMAQFWFLYALMLCQILASLLAPRRGMLVAVATAAFAVAAVLPQGGIVEEFLHAFPFFTAGVLLAGAGPLPRGRGAASAAIAFVGLVATIGWSGSRDGMNFDSPLAVPSALCGIALLVILANVFAGAALRATARLGRMSMTVYVMHILAAAGTRIVLVKLRVPADPWLYLAACTCVGLAAPLAAHIVLERLHLLAPLGLAPLRPQRPRAPLPA